MAVLAVQSATRSGNGLTPTYGAVAAGGDSFPNNGRTMLHFKNSNGATRTVTVASQASFPADSGRAAQNLAAVIPATTGDKMIGPFPPEIWGESVNLTYSADAGLTVAVVSLPLA